MLMSVALTLNALSTHTPDSRKTLKLFSSGTNCEAAPKIDCNVQFARASAGLNMNNTIQPTLDETLPDAPICSMPALAGELGRNANNLRVRHHRARQQLRERLEQTCRLCAKHGCLDCTCGD